MPSNAGTQSFTPTQIMDHTYRIRTTPLSRALVRTWEDRHKTGSGTRCMGTLIHLVPDTTKAPFIHEILSSQELNENEIAFNSKYSLEPKKSLLTVAYEFDTHSLGRFILHLDGCFLPTEPSPFAHLLTRGDGIVQKIHDFTDAWKRKQVSTKEITEPIAENGRNALHFMATFVQWEGDWEKCVDSLCNTLNLSPLQPDRMGMTAIQIFKNRIFSEESPLPMHTRYSMLSYLEQAAENVEGKRMIMATAALKMHSCLLPHEIQQGIWDTAKLPRSLASARRAIQMYNERRKQKTTTLEGSEGAPSKR